MDTSTIFYGILLLITLLLLAYAYFTRNFNYWKKRNVYYVKPTPFLGNLLLALKSKQNFGTWLGQLTQSIKQDYFGIFLFDEPVFIVKSPKLVKTIIQKDFWNFPNKALASVEFDPVLSHMMFTSKAHPWKDLRTMANPVFTSGKLKAMFPHALNESNAMVDYIKTFANVPDIEAKEICAKYTINVIARCAFSVNARSFQDKDAEFRSLGRKSFEMSYSNAFRQFCIWFAPNFATRFKIAIVGSDIIQRLKEIFTEVLQTRKTSLTLKGNDLIDILLEAERKKNGTLPMDDAMLGQAIQFFLAGFETVNMTLSFALYELCVHPEIQEKLRREILDHIDKDQGITYEGIHEMEYLDMCVSETLRKYPVLAFLDRKCIADYKIEGTDLIIEKGMSVYVPIFGLHYDPEYFPEPEKFIPERFADKSKINNDGFNYIPFGEGPRVCLGKRYGLMVVKSGIINILSKYRLEVSSKTPIPLKYDPKIVIPLSIVGLPMKFVPLEGNN